MFFQKILISAVALSCCAIPASASLTTYCTSNGGPGCSDASNSAASSALAAATADDTFQNITVTNGSLGISYTDDGLDFMDPAGLNGTSNPSGWPAGTAVTTNAGVSTLTITLPSDVDAIEFYVGMQDFSNFTISVTDNAGGNFSSGYFAQTVSVMDPLFFGITTTGSFNTFTITSQASIDQITLDCITFSGSGGGDDAPPTPEAATMLLVGTGLLVMGYWRRKKGHAAKRGTVCTMSTGITPA